MESPQAVQSQADALVQAVSACLLPLADAGRAPQMRAYMRNKFDFLGISTPVRRAAVAALLKPKLTAPALLGCANALWQQPQREYQYVAVDLLARQWQVLSLPHLDAVLALVPQRAWWDSVDSLAGVVGDILHAASRQDPAAQQTMDLALRHPDFWLRRIAMLHQLGWRQDTDQQRLLAYASHLGHETEFFIRKAIGWALRDYARHAPAVVRAYLAADGAGLSSLSIREASKHLLP